MGNKKLISEMTIDEQDLLIPADEVVLSPELQHAMEGMRELYRQRQQLKEKRQQLKQFKQQQEERAREWYYAFIWYSQKLPTLLQ